MILKQSRCARQCSKALGLRQLSLIGHALPCCKLSLTTFAYYYPLNISQTCGCNKLKNEVTAPQLRSLYQEEKKISYGLLGSLDLDLGFQIHVMCFCWIWPSLVFSWAINQFLLGLDFYGCKFGNCTNRYEKWNKS